MNNIIPFDFDGSAVRVVTDDSGEPWFVAADIAKALDYAEAKDMTRNLDDDEKGRQLVPTPGGGQDMLVINEAGLFSAILKSQKPEARRFKRWVTHDVLPSIRKTGSYSVGEPTNVAAEPIRIAADALRLAPSAVRAARAFGLDKNAAAISAGQFIRGLTGVNLLEGLGCTHLLAERQDTLWYTPTELGKRLEVSARQFNLLLAEAGLQAKQGEHWMPTPAAESFSRLFDTGKRHGGGTPVQQVKWAENVLALIKPTTEAA